GPAASGSCLRPETAPMCGTPAGPDRRFAAGPLHRFRERPCAVARARGSRPKCPRRARWRVRTHASATPAPAAEAVRDILSAARSMSGSCARYACMRRGPQNRTTGHHKRAGVKKSFSNTARGAMAFSSETSSNPRQHQFGPQSADRRVAERKAASIKGRQIGHNRQAESRTWLRLVKPLAAARDLRALGRRQPAPVIVDGNAKDRTSAGFPRRLLAHLDEHVRGRPFAGVVDEIAGHLLEVLPLAAKLRLR